MVDEQGTTQTHADAGATTDGAAAQENGAQRGEETRQDAGGTAQHGDWPDLEAYCGQLGAEHEAWMERLTALQSQLAHLQPALLGMAAQYRALAIEEDLERLNRLVLGGAAMAQSLRLGYDLERYFSLLWPAAGDPRPTHARPEGQGEYRVDVVLHVGPDGRGRVRVEGEKRLEAPLPTSRERLRKVLLSAIQSPKYVGTPDEHATETEGATGPAHQQEEPTTQAEAEPEPHAHAGPRTEVGTDEPVPAAQRRTGDPDEQPPPDEQVIPLGPATEAEADDKPKRRRKKP
jgi:hypothetical protein